MGGRFCMCFDQRESWTVITRKLFPEVDLEAARVAEAAGINPM